MLVRRLSLDEGIILDGILLDGMLVDCIPLYGIPLDGIPLDGEVLLGIMLLEVTVLVGGDFRYRYRPTVQYNLSYKVLNSNTITIKFNRNI